MSAMVVQGVTEKERASGTGDHERRIKDLESQVRSLFTITERLDRYCDRNFDAVGALTTEVYDLTHGGDEGVVTLRITAERGGR